MPGEGQPAPTRFPCLCRAIYSWGGENRGDLGFVEGDLIECLNAGDGQWWVGRLKRNRMVGEFPSNFVEIVDEPQAPAPPPRRPVSRAGSASPMPFSNGRDGGGSITRSHSPAPPRHAHSRNGSPRRDGYDYADERYGQQSSLTRRSQPPSRAISPAPPVHYPQPPQHYRGSVQDLRAVSPAPSAYHHHQQQQQQQQHYGGPQRGVSPSPSAYHRRHASPAVPAHYNRGPSPQPPRGYDDDDEGMPPAPPPHRSTPSPIPPQHLTPGHSRAPTPSQHTPSPLRSAMEDVMSSLQDMVSHDGNDPYAIDRPLTPLDSDEPWNPHAFRDAYSGTPSKQLIMRPQTSLGIGHSNIDALDDNDPYENNGIPRYNTHRPSAGVGGSYSETMEDRLRRFQQPNIPGAQAEDTPPAPPPKRYTTDEHSQRFSPEDIAAIRRPLTANFEKRRSLYEIGSSRGNTKSPLSRFATVKSSATNSSSNSNAQSVATNSTGMTSASLMSGISAGGFSATSAGSLARRKVRAMSVVDSGGFKPQLMMNRPETPSASGSGSGSGTGSLSSNLLRKSWRGAPPPTASESDSALFGGHAVPKMKKPGFLKKLLNGAKATTQGARSLTYTSPLPPVQPSISKTGEVITGIQGGLPTPKQTSDWVQVRRDVHRANSLKALEREERVRRLQLIGQPIYRPVDALDEEVDGDEAGDGGPVRDPVDFAGAPNLALVDKTARFINNLPLFTSAESLAQMHICRPYRTDVQKLRAIFTWVSEKIAWERPPPVDELMEPQERERMEIRRVMQSKRGSPEEVATVVMQMCVAVGIEAQVVRGYLKAPGEAIDLDAIPRPNHCWNAVVCDGEWRMMDCSLASPTHPRRSMYSTAPATTTDFHYFLTVPSKFCWTHVPIQPKHQHMVPPLPIANLLALPVVTSVFFQHNLQMINFDTSLLHSDGLEVIQIDFVAPIDIECIAEVESRSFTIDATGDVFESGEVVKKRALAQVAWESGIKTYRIKAITPGDADHSVLKVYAGRRGLTHSIKDNPHPLAFALPLTHSGENPEYEFIPRHPTPHATKHDLYVQEPQCYALALNQTFVFATRQHLSSGAASSTEKPAKLAIQTPSGKIMRLMKKGDATGSESGMLWETIVKCTERGAWRALVLADRTHRWCVYAEWQVC
ncbi:hypothetical protein DFH27DRAFT_483110 [Peziza echinospora]|nr:hypothetical protein DFH27DRAFT_483110 [Peziza echinospora]